MFVMQLRGLEGPQTEHVSPASTSHSPLDATRFFLTALPSSQQTRTLSICPIRPVEYGLVFSDLMVDAIAKSMTNTLGEPVPGATDITFGYIGHPGLFSNGSPANRLVFFPRPGFDPKDGLELFVDENRIYALQSRLELGETIDYIENLVSFGVLKPNALHLLGFSEEEIGWARQSRETRREWPNVFKALNNTEQVHELAPSSEYRGGNVEPVLQGEGVFIRWSDDTKAIYTSNAERCAILICVAKDGDGKAVLGGMAHIDGVASHADIEQFFKEMKERAGDRVTFEVSVISGAENTALRIFSHASRFIIENAGSSFDIISCDLTGSRDDAALLALQDGKAAIYYGPWKEFPNYGYIEQDLARSSGKPFILRDVAKAGSSK